MLLPTPFASFAWDAAFFNGLIWGGLAMAAVSLIQLVRAMFAEGKKDRDAEQAQARLHNLLIGCIALGVCMAFGGYWAKNKFSGTLSGEFREYVSSSGRFRALFPGSPKEQSQSLMGLRLHMYSVENKDGLYAVAYCDVPLRKGEDPLKLQNRLTQSRDGMLKNVSAKLTSDARVSLNNRYPGREIFADVPTKNAKLAASIYLVDDRLYQVLVIGKESWVRSDHVRKFLNSFALR